MNSEIFALLVLFIYMPCHFFEEAMGNFPLWMSKHWTPYRLSYGHWMANNIFTFYPLLVICYLLYRFLPQTPYFLGGGLLVWGIINTGDHAFYTIKDRKVSPGLWTGIVYLVNAFMGFRAFEMEGNLSVLMIIGSILTGTFMFVLPTVLAKPLGNRFMRIFGAYHEEA